MDEKLAGEATLRASGMPFTIVRPGGLTNVEGGKAVLSYSASESLTPMCIALDHIPLDHCRVSNHDLVVALRMYLVVNGHVNGHLGCTMR